LPSPCQAQGQPRAQAAALEVGAGRLVVFADATLFTAQIWGYGGGDDYPVGMNRDDCGNRQLVLNSMHWLSRLI
jgi:hypothetical protein